MRSNIARTCGSGRVPDSGMPGLTALEGPEVIHEVVELLRVLLPEVGEGGHRRGWVDQGPGDRRTRQPAADIRQVGTGSRVAVLADAVAAEAAVRGRDVLAALEVG